MQRDHRFQPSHRHQFYQPDQSHGAIEPVYWNSGSLWEMTGYASVITLIGAGGKTTTLQSLVREVDLRGRKVIATTTTKVYPLPFASVWCDPVFPPPDEGNYPCFWYAGRDPESPMEKWRGPDVESVDQAIRTKSSSIEKVNNKEKVVEGEQRSKGLGAVLEAAERTASNEFVWVIEGDGAREKKLKCWASHEPQIPLASECVVLILPEGLWGKVLTEEEVHRPEICPGLAGQVWTAERAVEYFLNSPVFDPQYRELSWILLFNEYDFSDNDLNDNDLNDNDPKDFKDNDLFNKYETKERFEESPMEATEGPRGKRDKNLRDMNLKEFYCEFLKRFGSERGKLPTHLRIAVGDVKGGQMTWCDLW